MQEKEKSKHLQFFCFDEKQPDIKKRILVARIIKIYRLTIVAIEKLQDFRLIRFRYKLF